MPFNVGFVTVAAFNKSLGGYYNTTNMLEETEVMGLIWHVVNKDKSYNEFVIGDEYIQADYFSNQPSLNLRHCNIPSQEIQDLATNAKDNPDKKSELNDLLKDNGVFDYDAQKQQYDKWISNIKNAGSIKDLQKAFMKGTTNSKLEKIFEDLSDSNLEDSKEKLLERLEKPDYNYELQYNKIVEDLASGNIKFEDRKTNVSFQEGVEYFSSILEKATSIDQIRQYVNDPTFIENFPGVKNAFDEVGKQCEDDKFMQNKFGVTQLEFMKKQLGDELKNLKEPSVVSRELQHDYSNVEAKDLPSNVHSYKTLVQNLNAYGHHTVFFTEGDHWTAAAFLKTDDGVKVFTFNSFGNFKEGPYTQNAGDIDIICNKLNQEQGIENVHKPEDCSIPIQFANNCGVCVGTFCGTFLKMAADEKEINAQTLKQEVANNFYGRDVKDVTKCSWNEKRVASNRVMAKMKTCC